MLDLKTIIAPVDLSERSRVAVEHAVALRNQFGSNMVFVHVIPMLPDEHPVNIRGLYPEAHWHGFEDLNAKLYDQMKALIDPLSGGHESEKLVLTGDPVSEIKKLAGERSAGLIVMPTHGYGPFRRFLLGSVTSKILHDSDCPVMTGAHMPELPPIAASPCEMGYVWKGSGETRNMHDETVMLDVYLLPSTGHYLYLINVKKPVRSGSTRR